MWTNCLAYATNLTIKALTQLPFAESMKQTNKLQIKATSCTKNPVYSFIHCLHFPPLFQRFLLFRSVAIKTRSLSYPALGSHGNVILRPSVQTWLRRTNPGRTCRHEGNLSLTCRIFWVLFKVKTNNDLRICPTVHIHLSI